MMVLNFSKDEYDVRVRLPVAGSARPMESSAEDRLVLNIDRDGSVTFGGRTLDMERAKNELRVQAQLVRRSAEVTGKNLGPEGALPTTLVIRADRETPCGQFYEIVRTCQGFGFRKFALKVMSGRNQG
jgi:biopolymer transport protein ExbD